MTAGAVPGQGPGTGKRLVGEVSRSGCENDRQTAVGPFGQALGLRVPWLAEQEFHAQRPVKPSDSPLHVPQNWSGV